MRDMFIRALPPILAVLVAVLVMFTTFVTLVAVIERLLDVMS